MTIRETKRLIRIYERAEQYENERRKLSMEGGPDAQLKAAKKMEKAERLFGQVSDIIRECARNKAKCG